MLKIKITRNTIRNSCYLNSTIMGTICIVYHSLPKTGSQTTHLTAENQTTSPTIETHNRKDKRDRICPSSSMLAETIKKYKPTHQNYYQKANSHGRIRGERAYQYLTVLQRAQCLEDGLRQTMQPSSKTSILRWWPAAAVESKLASTTKYLEAVFLRRCSSPKAIKNTVAINCSTQVRLRSAETDMHQSLYIYPLLLLHTHITRTRTRTHAHNRKMYMILRLPRTEIETTLQAGYFLHKVKIGKVRVSNRIFNCARVDYNYYEDFGDFLCLGSWIAH